MCFFLECIPWINPQEITGKFPGYLSPSAGLKFADVPNGLAAISKVPAAGQGWNNWIHLKIRTAYIYIYTIHILYFIYNDIYIYITNNNSNKNSNNSMNKYHKIILYTDSIYFHISSFKRSWYMMICNLLSPNLHYNYDSITCFFADLCGLLRGPICQPWRMGSDLGLHGFLRGLPGTDPRKCCVCWRLWIQGVDLFWPGWENQKA